MIEIKYVCSNGNEYNLIGDRMRATKGNFHKYSWKKVAQETERGDLLKGFTKAAITYAITLNFRGRLEDRKRLLNRLRVDFERDIATKMPGTIIFGEYYIKGFVIESDTGVSETKNNWTQDDIKIYCPYPFWVKENTFYFVEQSFDDEPAEQSGSGGHALFGLPFGFKRTLGKRYIHNSSYIDSDFVMTISGYVDEPTVMIAGHPYTIHTILYDHERLIIDSKAGTIVRIGMFGDVTNLYNSRDKICSVFRKIPPGDQILSWSGGFSLSITIYDERSEPEWSL